MATEQPPELVQRMVDAAPLGRLGEPDEAAAMITWLASEECSFSTGAVFDLSGGRSVA
jgi:3-oxoacyl-[acyl-carrier protein] reductase